MIKYVYFILFSSLIFSCNKKDEFACDTESDSPAVNCNSTNVSSSTNGFKVNYYPDGTTKKSEGNYSSGVQQGFWKFYYQNSNLLKEGNFTSGKIKGFWKLYFENGNINEEGNYDNCIRNGFWKFYYDNANNSVRKEGEYKNGVKSGNWVYYNPDGSILKQGNC